MANSKIAINYQHPYRLTMTMTMTITRTVVMTLASNNEIKYDNDNELMTHFER